MKCFINSDFGILFKKIFKSPKKKKIPFFPLFYLFYFLICDFYWRFFPNFPYIQLFLFLLVGSYHRNSKQLRSHLYIINNPKKSSCHACQHCQEGLKHKLPLNKLSYQKLFLIYWPKNCCKRFAWSIYVIHFHHNFQELTLAWLRPIPTLEP